MGGVKVLSTKDTSAWQTYLGLIPKKELVHSPDYTRVYEKYGDGMGECFVYEDDGVVLYPYLVKIFTMMIFISLMSLVVLF